MPRTTLALLVVNLVLSLTALGWLGWITVAPRHWFADAYAQKGARGDPGPRGPAGPGGPPGPVGPDASDAIAELDARLTDLEDGTSTSDLETRVEDLEGLVNGTDVSDLESRLTDLEDTLTSICDAMSYSYNQSIVDIYNGSNC